MPADTLPSPATDDGLRPGLAVLHGNRLELLAEAVFGWLDRAPLAPLESEVFLVQSNGTAEWLKARLAQRRGICAAVRTELPARFVWRSYRAVLGAEGAPMHSPLDEAPLRWRLLRLLPELARQPGFEPLAGFLAADGGGITRRLQLAGVLADLFDQYQVYRADWLRAWGQGRAQLLDGQGRATPLPADQAWQPRLWQALLASVGEGQGGGARPEVHEHFLRALRQRAPDTLAEGAAAAHGGLPRRVVVFGLTQLPQQSLQALAALAAHCQVLIALPNPCRFHWADLIDGREWFAGITRRQRLRGEAAVEPAAQSLHLLQPQAHPLLAAWGRQGRDFMRLLDAHDSEWPRIELFDEDEPAAAAPAGALLQQVQAAVRDLLPLAEHPRAQGRPAPADRSIVFHVAHSAQREVEVLHGQLLALLSPSLSPRDVVVMVPGLEPFEAAIRAVFDQYPPGDARHIPYAIADLGPRGRDPLLLTLDWLLRAPEPRCTASELRDLLALPALARRFGFSADDLPQLEQWLQGSGLRWGLDAEHRQALGLGEVGEVNTWRFAVERMLLGYASGEGPAFDEVEPYAEVGGLEAALAGGLAGLFEALRSWWRQAVSPCSPADWAARLRQLLADLFDTRGAEAEADRQLLSALDAALTRWLDDCDRAAFDEPVPLAVARAGWLDALEAPSLAQRFTGGGVTFCTLLPMRAIPFEVVCLLGMNEGDYPRCMPRRAFDLMARPEQRRPGDRAARDDDRYLMLEALLAARRLLYVSWVGRSVRDNSAQPPSVLVGELRDYLDAGFGAQLSARLTTEHPLQPFSRRYFEPGAAERGWISHAREWRLAHGEAAASQATEVAALDHAASLAPSTGEERPTHALPDAAPPPFDTAQLLPLTVQRLARFLRQPVTYHYDERLRVRFDPLDAGLDDDEPFDVDGLQQHRWIEALLTAAQRGAAAADDDRADDAADALLRQATERLQREGALPHGAAGQQLAERLRDQVRPMHAAWQAWQQAHPEPAAPLPLRFDHAGLQVDDGLNGLRQGPGGRSRVTLSASRLLDRDGETLRPRVLIETWLQALLLAVGDGGGHGSGGLGGEVIAPDARLCWQPPAEADARAALGDLLELWQAGLQQPLPVACRSALAYLKHDSFEAAEHAYDGASAGGHRPQPGEGREPCLARHWPTFADLAGEGRFDELARRLYGPLLAWAHALTVQRWSPCATEGGR